MTTLVLRQCDRCKTEVRSTEDGFAAFLDVKVRKPDDAADIQTVQLCGPCVDELTTVFLTGAK